MSSSSFLGLGAAPAAEDSDESVIHQDSDEEDVLRDDDIDIGFRRHHYETFDDEDGNRRSRQRRKRSRQQNKDENIYGVFYEAGRSNRLADEGNQGAPMFVAATKADSATTKPATEPSTEPEKAETASMFVPAVSTDDVTKTKPQASEDDVKPTSEQPPQEEKSTDEQKQQQQVQEQQKAADDYFQSLLLKAKDKKRKRPRPPSPSAPTTDPALTATSYLQQQKKEAERPTPVIKKDPSIARWEQHTKGLGSKLLAKMGWSGKGGLGSNRRKRKSPTPSTLSDANMSETRETAPDVTSMSGGPPSTVEGEEGPARKGISRPVEVVVRPANLGLGFGNFKEMSQLRSNRQIEAEVRGIELPNEKGKGRKRRGVTFGDSDDEGNDEMDIGALKSVSSALPSTQELLTQKAWKKRKTKRQAPKIISYQELIAKHEEKHADGHPFIIDMRGPTTDQSKAAASKDGAVALGEELLHNVTLMLNTHENQLHSNMQLVKATERKEASLKSQIEDLEHQQKQIRDRHTKMTDTLTVLDQIEASADQYAKDPRGIQTVLGKIQALGVSFSAEDRSALKFWQALAPTLLSPVLHRKLYQWDPLGPIHLSRSLLDSLFSFNFDEKNPSSDDEAALKSLRHSILQDQLIPRLQEVLESSKWDVIHETVVVELYEYLQGLALPPRRTTATNNVPTNMDDNQVFPAGPVDEDVDEMADSKELPSLVDLFHKELILHTVYPKIQVALSQWKPARGAAGGLEQRLDHWIMPWMPHLDHPSILPTLLADCKRKLKSCLSILQRTVGKERDLAYIQASLDVLKPWAKVFDTRSLQKMTSEYVTPYLARYLAKSTGRQSISIDEKFLGVRLTRDAHKAGLLSDLEFLSLIEGESLPALASAMNAKLASRDARSYLTEAAKDYVQWKLELLTRQPDRSTQLLQQDACICGIFFTVLRMIQIIAENSDTEELEALDPPSTNYHVVLARRSKERQARVQEDFVRMESRSKSEVQARLRLRRRQVETPTFRDVVEEFAHERGIVFQPRMGPRGMIDGKQVYQFGDIPIYLDGDVVYAARQGSDWRPVSLDDLEKA